MQEEIKDELHGSPCLRELSSTLRVSEDGVEEVVEIVAVEAAVTITYGNTIVRSASMSPREVDDYAVGFAFTSGIIDVYDDIVDISVLYDKDPIEAHVTLREGLDLESRADLRSSASEWRLVAAGGEDAKDSRVCEAAQPIGAAATPQTIGAALREQPIDSTTSQPDAPSTLPKPRQLLNPQAIWNVSETLMSLQGMHQATGATHAASFAGFDGKILFLSEDVGRHNAVDKLIGALLASGADAEEGFAFLSSRCALELVEKLLRFGIKIIATISAPTSAVIDLALREGITICAFSREKRFTVYTHPERLLL